MGIGSAGYITIVVIHIVCVIVGFGGVVLNGVYATRAAKLPPDQALAVMETNTFVSLKVAEIFVYLTPIFGLAAVGLSDEAWSMSDLWVWLSLVIFIVALGVSHGLLVPRVKRLLATQRELVTTPPSGAEDPRVGVMGALGAQVGGLSMLLDLALVVIIVLMVWKPT